MTTAPALTRAQTVLNSNRYFVLATLDAQGPWAAVLAYTTIAPNHLYFFSEKTSRHGQALLNGAKVAGVIYDSHCTPEVAESLQFSGKGELAHNYADISKVLGTTSEEQIQQALQSTSTLLFRVSIDEAFVLDQKLYIEQGIDGREPVSAKEIFTK